MSMNIDDYINTTCVSHPSPRLYEFPELISKYEKVIREYDICIKQIFSTSFFPRLIHSVNDNSNYLLWDNHFWDLFERFFYQIICIENDDQKDYIAYDFFISIFSIFLASRFYNAPYLSLALAKRYASTGFFVPPYFIDNNVRLNIMLKKSLSNLTYCKDFVFFHEVSHAIFRTDIDQKKYVFQIVKDVCLTLLKQPISFETKKSIKNILESSDNLIFEELCCDVNSICTVVMLYSGGKKYDNVVATEIVKSLRILLLFINSLKRIDTAYTTYYKTSNLSQVSKRIISGDNYDEMEIRDYAVFFVIQQLMGLNLNLDREFFLNDSNYNMYFKPYYDFLSIDFLKSVFTESIFYSNKFSKDICGTTRDIIIGWHSN